jgi:hypothetical protein
VTLYWTEWEATVVVRQDGETLAKYRARRQTATSAEARASMRRSAKAEFGEDVRVSVMNVRQLIWDRSS